MSDFDEILGRKESDHKKGIVKWTTLTQHPKVTASTEVHFDSNMAAPTLVQQFAEATKRYKHKVAFEKSEQMNKLEPQYQSALRSVIQADVKVLENFRTNIETHIKELQAKIEAKKALLSLLKEQSSAVLPLSETDQELCLTISKSITESTQTLQHFKDALSQ